MSPFRCRLNVPIEGQKGTQDIHVFDIREAGTLVYCVGGHHTRVTAQIKEHARKKRLKGYFISFFERACDTILDHVVVSLYGMDRVFMSRNCVCCQRPLPKPLLIKALQNGGTGYCSAACKRLLARWRSGG